jgi:hypothetical protein
LIEMSGFSLVPSVSIAYGNSDLGQIEFEAIANGISVYASLDAENVAIGILRLTPEIRIPLGGQGVAEEALTVGLLPSLICQHTLADSSKSECGWGAGIQIIQNGTEGLGQFTGRFDFEQIGDLNRIGGEAGYMIRF